MSRRNPTSGRSGRSRLRWHMLVILAVLGVGAAAEAQDDECGAAPAAWVFCTGFEEGDFSLWDDWDGNPPLTNQLVADPGPHGRAGNHVARLFVPPGRGVADLTKVLPTGHDVLYARWYAKWEPGFDFTTPQHGGGLHAGDRALVGHSGDRPDGDDWFSAWIEPGTDGRTFSAYTYYRGMYMDCVDPAGRCWGDDFPCIEDEGENICTNPAHRDRGALPVMEAGRWYAVEIMMDGGTPSADGSVADGVLNFWIDGVPVGPWSDLWLRTTEQLELDVLWLSLFFHGEHGPAGLLLDDVVISTRRIGPYAPSSPEETESWGEVKSTYR